MRSEPGRSEPVKSNQSPSSQNSCCRDVTIKIAISLILSLGAFLGAYYGGLNTVYQIALPSATFVISLIVICLITKESSKPNDEPKPKSTFYSARRTLPGVALQDTTGDLQSRALIATHTNMVETQLKNRESVKELIDLSIQLSDNPRIQKADQLERADQTLKYFRGEQDDFLPGIWDVTYLARLIPETPYVSIPNIETMLAQDWRVCRVKLPIENNKHRWIVFVKNEDGTIDKIDFGPDAHAHNNQTSEQIRKLNAEGAELYFYGLKGYLEPASESAQPVKNNAPFYAGRVPVTCDLGDHEGNLSSMAQIYAHTAIVPNPQRECDMLQKELQVLENERVSLIASVKNPGLQKTEEELNQWVAELQRLQKQTHHSTLEAERFAVLPLNIAAHLRKIEELTEMQEAAQAKVLNAGAIPIDVQIDLKKEQIEQAKLRRDTLRTLRGEKLKGPDYVSPSLIPTVVDKMMTDFPAGAPARQIPVADMEKMVRSDWRVCRIKNNGRWNVFIKNKDGSAHALADADNGEPFKDYIEIIRNTRRSIEFYGPQGYLDPTTV